MTTRVGEPEVSHSARGNPTYRVELWHDELRKHRVIRDADPGVLQRKLSLQVAEWNQKWEKTAANNAEQQNKEASLSLAAERTEEAVRELDLLNGILKQTLDVDDAIDWDALMDASKFPEPRPQTPPKPPQPAVKAKPPEPQFDSSEYRPRLGLLGRLIPSRKERLLASCRVRFENDRDQWERQVAAINEGHALAMSRYREELVASEQRYAEDIASWESRRQDFLEKQRQGNDAIRRQRDDYLAGAPDAVAAYCDMVLSASRYPDYFPKEFEIAYEPESKTIVVDYSLPSPDQMPTLKDVKYVASRKEFGERHISSAQANKLYDDVLYQVALRTVHELFEADVAGALDAVAFNGIVSAMDRSSGQLVTSCVLSLLAQREPFLAINLQDIDYKACFRALKGAGSSKLHGLAAVPPILQISRVDSRFVTSYDVAGTLDSSLNLASMDWEDFEHLIREIFEKEFSAGGGEVKVTQASRDGGVDAVAFDPDPIRGGKIVIQAKRYTNTVGVAAVRDLYGTVMNEGANKGILVTTSDYGPDAYAFAQGKPLTLLSGSNLLHMLAKHGHKARIDLQEARRIARESE